MGKEAKTFDSVANGELQAKIDALEAGRFPSDDIPGLQPKLVAGHLREFTERLTSLTVSPNTASLTLYEQGRTTDDPGTNLRHFYGAGNLLLQALLGDPDARVFQRWEKHTELFKTAKITPETIGRFKFARVTIPSSVDNMVVVYDHQNSGAHIQGGRVTQGSYAMFPSLVKVVINPQPLS